MVGIAAGVLGAEVAITDRDDESTLSLIASNVLANLPEDIQERVQVRELTWGKTEPEDLWGPDYVLSSDPLVCEGCIPVLIETLLAICGDWPKTKVIMATELRDDSIHLMFVSLLLKAGLKFAIVPSECLHPEYVAPYIVVYIIAKPSLPVDA